MALEKLYGELMELHASSGKDFFPEVVALLANWMPGREHTILGRDERGSRWKPASSTLKDPDEVEFLRAISEKEFQGEGEGIFLFSMARPGIRAHAVIPLMFKRNEAVGVWILERKGKERIGSSRELLQLGRLLACFLRLCQDERQRMLNRYMDAAADLPGRLYFEQVTGRLQEQGHKAVVSAFRWEKYREGIRTAGARRMEQKIRGLAQRVIRLELGNAYILAEDTIAVLSVESREEVYAGVESILELEGMGNALKAVIMELGSQEDILMEIEAAFSVCGMGVLQAPGREKTSQLSALFGTEGKPAGKAASLGIPKGEEEPAEDLLRMLERGGSL